MRGGLFILLAVAGPAAAGTAVMMLSRSPLPASRSPLLSDMSGGQEAADQAGEGWNSAARLEGTG
ncbi:hypothetical protein [Streptomyces sp. NPDC056160]|uniref:hypothetical protein n=1 Tax=Streptomyces sp. NPDC056160 TaxID=3345731 RepID=UPI0035DFF23D